MNSMSLMPARAVGAPPRLDWRQVLGVAGGVFLGLVLLVAAWTKLLDPLAFAEQIRAEGLDFLLSAPIVAYIALALEVGLGVALVLGVRRNWVLIPATLLVAFFLFLTGRAYYLDSQGLLDPEAASCGCFGNLVDRTPAQAFWQDLLLLVPPLALAFLGRPATARRFPPLRTAAVGALAVAAVVFAVQAPELPLDNLATRLKPGAEADGLCIQTENDQVCLSTVVPELRDGRHVVVLAEVEDESFPEMVPALNEYALAGSGPRLWVLSSASQEALTNLFWTLGPAFEIRETPEPLLRPMYRRLPRSFQIEDGRVTATYDGLPPLNDLDHSDHPGGAELASSDSVR